MLHVQIKASSWELWTWVQARTQFPVAWTERSWWVQDETFQTLKNARHLHLVKTACTDHGDLLHRPMQKSAEKVFVLFSFGCRCINDLEIYMYIYIYLSIILFFPVFFAVKYKWTALSHPEHEQVMVLWMLLTFRTSPSLHYFTEVRRMFGTSSKAFFQSSFLTAILVPLPLQPNTV